jgi:predicted membrane-bound spermidine synthase
MRKSDIVFFLTGASALVCETVWARLLARVLGSDAGAAAIVLATFMGGMGAGALLFAGLAHRTARPVRWFAAFEVFVGAWAALSPSAFVALHPVDGFTARALVAAAILVPPTLAMGASFPLMGRIAIGRDAETARETSAFYAANTVGGALGCLLGPCFFMPLFGLSGALRAAAVVELAAASLALVLLAPACGARAPIVGTAPEVARVSWTDPFLWVALLLGATSLALEVLLLRLLVTVTGASVYAFALVVGVFLLGIALGSRRLATARPSPSANIGANVGANDGANDAANDSASTVGAHARTVFSAALAAP